MTDIKCHEIFKINQINKHMKIKNIFKTKSNLKMNLFMI